MADSIAVIFSTCVVDAIDASLVDQTRRVLEKYGIRSSVVRATCCGQPAANSGQTKAARRVARTTLRALAAVEHPIVLPSGSCTAMIRHQWPKLFAGTRDEQAALSVAARTYELTEFLARQPRRVAPHATGSVVYHASCHLTRQLHVIDEPVAALAAAGHQVARADDGGRCCGFGGTFATEFEGVSVAMADEKLNALLSTSAASVTSCDLSCLTHLEARAKHRDVSIDFDHIARLL